MYEQKLIEGNFVDPCKRICVVLWSIINWSQCKWERHQKFPLMLRKNINGHEKTMWSSVTEFLCKCICTSMCCIKRIFQPCWRTSRLLLIKAVVSLIHPIKPSGQQKSLMIYLKSFILKQMRRQHRKKKSKQSLQCEENERWQRSHITNVPHECNYK